MSERVSARDLLFGVFGPVENLPQPRELPGVDYAQAFAELAELVEEDDDGLFFLSRQLGGQGAIIRMPQPKTYILRREGFWRRLGRSIRTWANR